MRVQVSGSEPQSHAREETDVIGIPGQTDVGARVELEVRCDGIGRAKTEDRNIGRIAVGPCRADQLGVRADRFRELESHRGRGNQLGQLLNPDMGMAPMPTLGLPPQEAVDPVADWLAGRHARAQEEFHSDKAKALWGDFGAGQERVASLEAHRDGFRGFNELEVVDNQVDMALHVLQHGLVRSVMIDSGNNWDTHYDNNLQIRYYDRMFTALGRLMQGLKSAPGVDGGTLLDETVVWVVSEMGRPPGMNDGYGKEHLPFTSSLLMGGGVKGGQMIGATDDRLIGQRVNLQTGALDDAGSLVRPDQLVAGLLEGCGVRADRWLPNVTPFMGPFES